MNGIMLEYPGPLDLRFLFQAMATPALQTSPNLQTLEYLTGIISSVFIPHHPSHPKNAFKTYSTVCWSVQVSNPRQLRRTKKSNDLGQTTSSNLVTSDIHHYVTKLSSKQQLEPGFWCGPQGLPVSIACCGRCVHRLSFEGRSCKAKPSLFAAVGCLSQAWSNIYGVRNMLSDLIFKILPPLFTCRRPWSTT